MNESPHQGTTDDGYRKQITDWNGIATQIAYNSFGITGVIWKELDLDIEEDFRAFWFTETAILSGLLHCMNRFAELYGGIEFRDKLQDQVAAEAIKQTVNAHWAEAAESRVDPEQWLKQGYDETLYNVNMIWQGLIGCQTIGSPEARTKFDRDSVWGNLAWYICQELGFDSVIEPTEKLPLKYTADSYARSIVYLSPLIYGLGESRLSDAIKSAADSWRSQLERFDRHDSGCDRRTSCLEQ